VLLADKICVIVVRVLIPPEPTGDRYRGTLIVGDALMIPLEIDVQPSRVEQEADFPVEVFGLMSSGHMLDATR